MSNGTDTEKQQNVDDEDKDVDSLSSSGCETATEPWTGFSRWLHCICVVTFDLELGQALEVVYPGHAELTEKEKMNICYLAFPDSNSGCMGDTVFHVRMRRFSSNQLSDAQIEFNKRNQPYVQVDPRYYFGFVYFRQIKDKSIKRGYLQKSVVLITSYPLIALFTHVIKTIAPEYFESGEPALEAACHDMDQWPAPAVQFAQGHQLPLLGSVVHVQLATKFDTPTKQRVTQPPASVPSPSPPVVLATSYEPRLYECVVPLLSQLQLLWELLLLAEPLVVMAASPTVSSSVVQALVSLVWPLNFACDYRPFFTIHDSEFKEYTAAKNDPPNVVLGVTNPFFTKTLQHWPHIIRLSDNMNTAQGNIEAQKIKKQNEIKTLDNKPGVYTHYKPLLIKDKGFVKALYKGKEQGRPAEAQSALIRRHFLEMTQSFMIPLERYIASLMPLQRQISPLKAAPCARQFDFNEFVATLETNGPALTTGVKGDWTMLYRKFVCTANFEQWHKQRQQEMQHKLDLLHLDVLCSTDFSALPLASMYEVELVDLVLKLRHKLDFVERHSESIGAERRARLCEQVRAVLGCVNDDLCHVLLHNNQLKLNHLFDYDDNNSQPKADVAAAAAESQPSAVQ